MTCQEARPLLSPYLDGELDPTRALAVEQHRRACAGCAAILDNQAQLSAAIAAAPYYPAPASLRARLDRRPSSRLRRLALWPAVVATAAGLLAYWSLRPVPLETAVVRAHVRSLQTGRLIETRAVRPWFAGKLDFALDVADVSGRGFLLMGGRLDSLNRRTVAALVYRNGAHIVNVFAWPADSQSDQPPAGASAGSLNLLHWRADGMNWWAVSDLELAELEQLPLCPCFLPVHQTLRG